ncbi:hypothetical protein CP10743SC13_1588 [Chlamydia psittaci 10_743_SC13]|nr:hypothetical protein CP10743SC13_1588 [Chlamydia psittaci 10_743_SC13]
MHFLLKNLPFNKKHHAFKQKSPVFSSKIPHFTPKSRIFSSKIPHLRVNHAFSLRKSNI